MKYLFNSILLLAISISLLSCKKKGCTDNLANNYDEKSKTDDGSCAYILGCTDCNATNYDVNALQDDNSCQYINETRLGIYTVADSIVDWSQTVWYNTYVIEIKRGVCNPTELTIFNYVNSTNQLTGDPLEVTCEILGDSIIINSQMIQGDNISGYSFDDFLIHSQKGSFRNDSIFLNLSYSANGADPN
jgi:hypothetical protein